jgi:hypothetical protein
MVGYRPFFYGLNEPNTVLSTAQTPLKKRMKPFLSRDQGMDFIYGHENRAK